MIIEPPKTLPVDSLSASSIRLYLQCAERWRRRYIEREPERSSGAAVVGSAAGRAEGHSYQQQVDGGDRLLVRDLLEAYSAEFDTKRAEDEARGGIDWDSQRPGKVKDSGTSVLALYHRHVAPHITPVSVERRFEIAFPGLDWTFRGFIDIEDATGAVRDIKSRARTKGVVTADEAAKDLQVDSYLFAKRAEARAAGLPDTPAGFFFDNMVRHPEPNLAHVQVTPAVRTHAQLDQFLATLYRIAAEIAWRTETGIWTGAPDGAWWCSAKWCGFHHTCPHGGALAPLDGAPAPHLIQRPNVGQVDEAVRSTIRKDGTTTAARVSGALGVSTMAAAGHLRGSAHRGVIRSERPFKRTKTKPPVPLTGPNVYRLLDDGTVTQQLTKSIRQINERVPA